MHRQYFEWKDVSKKVWGPVTVQQAVEDICELTTVIDDLTSKNSHTISIRGHELSGNYNAISAVQEWERQAYESYCTIKELRKRIEELENNPRVKQLKSKIIEMSVENYSLRKQLTEMGTMP